MAAKWEARRQGYDDVLLVDEDGYIAEGPTTNVFFFDADGTLRTPPDRNVLLGVTRSAIDRDRQTRRHRRVRRRVSPARICSKPARSS